MLKKILRIDIARLKDFLRKTGIRPIYLVLSIALSFGAALFDGIGMGLLVPIAKGVIGMDFSFVKEMPFFKTIIHGLPNIFISTTNPNSSIFLLLLAVIFIALIIKNIFWYFSAITISYQATRLSKNLRDIIFSRYLNFGKLFFDRTNIGRLHTILIDFTDSVALLVNYLRDLINNVFTLAAYLCILCFISWKLTTLTLILFPALYYSLGWLIRKIKVTSKHYAESKIKQAWKIFDVLSCLTLVRSYAREKKENENFARLSDSVARLEFSNEKKILLINPIQEAVVTLALLFIISTMAFMFVKGYRETVSKFLVFFYIFRRCAPLFNGINTFKARLAKFEGPLKGLAEILNDKDKFFVPSGNAEFVKLREKIEFRNLNFSYAKNPNILKGASFSIEKNKLTAIVGPTGSGKTTLINLTLRFYDCPPASIFIDGQDIRNFTLASIRRNMSLVSQDAFLFNDTIKNNIIYGMDKEVSEEEVMEAVKKSRLYDFVMGLPERLDTFIGDRGIKLSGGEKQRISIARALIKGSEILIMDEATSSLDSKTERLIQEAIDESIKDKTAIVIAHRLSTVKHADKIVVIENGEVVEEGATEDLLGKKGRFHEYWEEQKFY